MLLSTPGGVSATPKHWHKAELRFDTKDLGCSPLSGAEARRKGHYFQKGTKTANPTTKDTFQQHIKEDVALPLRPDPTPRSVEALPQPNLIKSDTQDNTDGHLP